MKEGYDTSHAMALKRRRTDESTIMIMGVSLHVDGGFGHGLGESNGKLEFSASRRKGI